MSGANSFKFVLLPPQSDTTRDWAKRLAEIVPEARVILAEDADTAAGEIVDAEAAFGWLGSDLLLKATKLRWLQAPQAAPPAGYYYPELIAHSVVVTNFREIFNDHIGAHILAFVLAFARGLHIFIPQQFRREWKKSPSESGDVVHLPEATALIVGVGGIGSEAARLLSAFGVFVLALDEYAEAFRARCHKKGVALGLTRIGVHAGPAIVGNFGGGRFFDYTAYGDTINVAARLEAANKQLGTRICVSAALADQVKNFHGRPVGDLVLRGKTEALRAFEPLRDEQFRDPETKSYLDAFAKLEAADPGALADFASHVGKQPNDQLASFHLKRVLNGATGTRIAME
jgi:class 3 adenylate cyclase